MQTVTKERSRWGFATGDQGGEIALPALVLFRSRRDNYWSGGLAIVGALPSVL